VLQSSLPVRSTLVAECELPRGGESEVLGDPGAEVGGWDELEGVREEKRDGRDRNGRHGHNV